MAIARHKTRGRELREARGLFVRAQRGDSRAFELLYATYEGRVYRYCHRLTGREETAAALAELTFTRAFTDLPEEGLETLDVPAYLYATATALAYERNGEPPGSRGGAESEVLAANERLSARERALLALRDLEGRPDGEIAAALAVEEREVAELVGSARLHLLAELRPPGADGPCQGTLGALSALADDLLAPEARAELEQHVLGCPDCRATLFALREAALRYRTLAVPEPPGELGSRIGRALGLVGLPPRTAASETLAAGGRQTAAAVAMGVLAIIGIGATIAAARSDDGGDAPARAPSPVSPSPQAQPSAPASGASLAAAVATVVATAPRPLRRPPVLRHVRSGVPRAAPRHAQRRRSIPPGLGKSYAPEAPPVAPTAPPASTAKTVVTTGQRPRQKHRIPVEIVPPPVARPQAQTASQPPAPPPASDPPPPAQTTTATT